jgi:D-3-phosphoglycerate dehydrogenase / 2-oxoglutarate reductase
LKKRLLIAETFNFSEKAIALVSNVVDVVKRDIKESDLSWAFKTYDFFWFRLGFQISEELLRQPERKVSVIICPVTGLDHINVETCNELGIKVISLKGEGEFLKKIRATSELTIGLMLSLLRKIPKAAEKVKSGIWERDLFRGNELYGKTIGIIGFGRLGQIIADYALAFGMKVIIYDVRKDMNNTQNQLTKIEDLKTLAARSDIISLHVNYDKKTHHLLDEEFFKTCLPHAYFVNTSRGGIVDEVALLKALERKWIKGAALDVMQDEPNINIDNPLVKYAIENDNIIIVPHIGGNTYESFEKTELFVADKLVKYVCRC